VAIDAKLPIYCQRFAASRFQWGLVSEPFFAIHKTFSTPKPGEIIMEHDMKHHTDQPKAPESKPAQGDESMKGMKGMSHNGSDHHAHMEADFRKRFWISLILTLPILVLSPLLQTLVGLREAIHFAGDVYILFGLSSVVFWYGGWPFLKGLFKELKSRQLGMMTLISVAITTAYLYSSAVVFGLTGKIFFWELASLIDIMLLGHWIEMKSVMGASRALEELAKLMPSDAHKLMPDGSVKDVPLSELGGRQSPDQTWGENSGRWCHRGGGELSQ